MATKPHPDEVEAAIEQHTTGGVSVRGYPGGNARIRIRHPLHDGPVVLTRIVETDGLSIRATIPAEGDLTVIVEGSDE